jgi:membrane-associated protease RseP (regulator of RpoE activity)
VSDFQPRPDRKWLNALLLAATLVTTTFAGTFHWLGFESDFQALALRVTPGAVVHGLWYSLTILAILGAHELGHYLACRYYGINASLPYFLPFPFPPSGTVGAFIRIRQPITSKRALFDIGIAGPLAGFAVAIPALVIGMAMSRVVEVPPNFTGFSLGEPLLFKAVSWLMWGSPPETVSINLHPMAFASWFGLLATYLNLIPIGQLDGGHIAYAALGRHTPKVTVVAALFAVGLSVYSLSNILWTLLAVGLLFAFGWRHPAVWDEAEPLDPARRWLALLALAIFVLCFMAAPFERFNLFQPK